MAENIDELFENEEVEQEEEEQKEASDIEVRLAKLEEEKDNYQKAMREERGKRHAAEERLEKLEDLKGRVESLLESRDKPKDPEFMEDPKGYVDQSRQAMEARLKDLEERAEAGSQEAQQRLAQLQFFQNVQADEAAFTREHPDYMEALGHIRTLRTEELTDLGLDEDEAKAKVNQEEIDLALTAMNKGKSPAEAAYKRAKTMGFKGKEVSLDEDAERLERAARAGSMGGSGVPDESKVDDPESEMWAPIEAAFEELFGQKLR